MEDLGPRTRGNDPERIFAPLHGSNVPIVLYLGDVVSL